MSGQPGFSCPSLAVGEIRMSQNRKINTIGNHYDANYGNFATALYEEIRREAFGEDIGQNSWLTADEQDEYLGWLGLTAGKALLDVACGDWVV